MPGTATCGANAPLALARIAGLGWPGLEAGAVGGWWLRAGGGFTGRANSALPPAESGTDLDAVLARVGAWYAARGLPALVQVALPEQEVLRAALLARGYQESEPTEVLVAAIAAGAAPNADVQIAKHPSPGWRALSGRAEVVAGDATALAVLRAGPDPRFATLWVGGRPAAVCRIIIAEGWAGLSDVEVAPPLRRRGLASALVRHVLAWAATVGAACAYLQVSEANAPARALYDRLGFAVHHTYRYLRAPG